MGSFGTWTFSPPREPGALGENQVTSPFLKQRYSPGATIWGRRREKRGAQGAPNWRVSARPQNSTRGAPIYEPGRRHYEVVFPGLLYQIGKRGEKKNFFLPPQRFVCGGRGTNSREKSLLPHSFGTRTLGKKKSPGIYIGPELIYEETRVF